MCTSPSCSSTPLHVLDATRPKGPSRTPQHKLRPNFPMPRLSFFAVAVASLSSSKGRCELEPGKMLLGSLGLMKDLRMWMTMNHHTPELVPISARVPNIQIRICQHVLMVGPAHPASKVSCKQGAAGIWTGQRRRSLPQSLTVPPHLVQIWGQEIGDLMILSSSRCGLNCL